MAQVPIAAPTIATFSTPGGIAEVVGGDPWGDLDDATYTKGYVKSDPDGGFHHLLADITPTVVDAANLTVSLRMSATASVANPETLNPRAVINLYAPTGDDPVLNLTAGASSFYVGLPSFDGTIHDIAATFIHWATSTPATPTQIEDYFAGGGYVLVQPDFTLGGGGTVAVTIHRLAFVYGAIPYRRTSHRTDSLAGGAGRNSPRSKSTQASNRTSGGYA